MSPRSIDCVDHNKLWKILQEMGVPDHLTCLLRNLYAGQEATVRTGHGTTDWFQIGKGVRQGCILSACLFNLHAEYIMRKAGLDEAQAGIKTAARNTIAQLVKNLPAMQEIWVLFLGREDPLEEEMATHSNILAWRIPWTEDPGRPQSMGSQRVGHN